MSLTAAMSGMSGMSGIAGGFTPAALSDLVSWVVAGSETYSDVGGTVPVTDGATVAVQRDRAGFNWVQGTAGSRPTYVAGSGLRYAGAQKMTPSVTPASLNTQNHTVWAVFAHRARDATIRKFLGCGQVSGGDAGSQLGWGTYTGGAFLHGLTTGFGFQSAGPDQNTYLPHGPWVVRWRSDSSGLKTLTPWGETTQAPSPGPDFPVSPAFLGQSAPSAGSFDGDVLEHIAISHACTTDEDVAVRSYLAAKYPSISMTFAAGTDPVLVVDGNSIAFGYSTTLNNDWLSLALPSLTGLTRARIRNVATPGLATPALTSRAAARVDALLSPGRRNVLCFCEGTNDIANNGASAATAYANILTYVAARLAARVNGAQWDRVIVWTIGPSATFGGAGFEATRNTTNTSLRSGAAGNGYTLLDTAADPNIGTQASASTSLYDSQFLHPSNTGSPFVSAVAVPVINTATS
jgi:lysophospholipase L1-like esterase